MGLFALVGAGILKTVYLGRDIRLDITPQDMGIKSMLCYTQKGADLYQQEDAPKELPVYMSSSCTHVSHTFTRVAEQMDELDLWGDAAFEKNLMIPGCHYTDRRWLYLFLVFTKQILPALMVDGLLKLFGQKPVLMGIVRKAYQTLEVMQPFMFNNYESPGVTEKETLTKENEGYTFSRTPLQGLLFYSILFLPCRTEFHLDAFSHPDIDSLVVQVSRDMVHSIRTHLLHEDPRTLKRSQRILKM